MQIKRISDITYLSFEITIKLFVLNQAIGIMVRVFANGLGDQGSIPGQAISKTQKNGTWCHLAQHYKVQIKGKVEQCSEWSSALPYISM